MLQILKTYVQSFAELIFPHLCCICGEQLLKHEGELCKPCKRKLPRTNFENDPYQNIAASILWGRAKAEMVIPIYFYRTEEALQKLLHQLKYRNNQSLGIELGQYAGNIIRQKDYRFDELIPIPLHRKKELLRGYNQSEKIAQGMSEILGLKVNTHSLFRIKNTTTQTKKNRYQRWENVDGIFDIRNPEALANKHLLLIDDVTTTGSTIEAAINTIHSYCDAKVSVLTIGYASL